MKMKRCDLVVSRSLKGGLSLTDLNGSRGGFRDKMRDEGFESDERVSVIRTVDLEALLTWVPPPQLPCGNG